MTNSIDQLRLRAAAEQLEVALLQHADDAYARALLQSFAPLLEAAKAERLREAIDQHDVPGAYNFGDGRFSGLQAPNVDDAYAAFATELAGGLSGRERQIIGATCTANLLRGARG